MSHSVASFKQRSCTRKVKYATWEEARIALGNDPSMHVYYCRFCTYFHLGHYGRRYEP